ncbi:basic proline-rich protein-like isoform X4 [Anthonomus grandis grandis]|uniref:basic proline-rich protein-like isoform X4 n=1 Tax=Anthonomus grandis grandis TaxID=2921223 RepID=UPI0021655344|nr:basic proline-rich protein-like isoform X4 [Anthonomus grandis grandis]
MGDMDILGPIIIVALCVVVFSICGWCCRRKKREGTVYGYGPSVTVTSQPVPNQQPYPVHGGPPPPGVYPPGGYPPAMPQPGQYPPPNVGTGGYPPPAGPYPPGPAGPYPPGAYPPAGYPPPQAGGYQAHPPPYDVAVSMPPGQPQPPQTEAYGKQAPYNPHYQS